MSAGKHGELQRGEHGFNMLNLLFISYKGQRTDGHLEELPGILKLPAAFSPEPPVIGSNDLRVDVIIIIADGNADAVTFAVAEFQQAFY